MKVLLAIPHVFAPHEGSLYSSQTEAKRASKQRALREATLGNLERHACEQWIHASLGKSKPIVTRRIELESPIDLTIEIHTHRTLNLLADLATDPRISIHHPATDNPLSIPLHAARHAIEQAEDYDIIGYIEDDIAIEDREFFAKIYWLVQNSHYQYVFLPHRCEVIPKKGDVILSGDPDGGRADLFWDTGESIRFSWPLGDKTFYRATNPHSGCWFLTRSQAIALKEHWESRQWIADFQLSGPLEQAGSGLLLPIFRIMKPKPLHSRFLMVTHQDELWQRHPFEKAHDQEKRP